MFCLHQVLEERRQNQELFDEGDYIPLEVEGDHSDHAIGFARSYGSDWYIIVVPRLLVSLCKNGVLPLGKETWADTKIVLPPNTPNLLTNVFTGKKINLSNELRLGEALSEFPVGLFKGTSV